MQEINQQQTRSPRFGITAGIGAILVYSLVSFPVITVIAVIKILQEKNKNSTLTSDQISIILKDLSANEWVLIVTLIVNCLGLFAYAYFLSKLRGSKNPFNDFGLRFSKTSPLYFFVGIACQFVAIAMGIVISALSDESKEQGVVTSFRNSSGLAFIIFFVLVSFVVPIAEEITFRAILQRGISKWVSPALTVLITGTIFGSIHLTDPGAILGLSSLIMVGLLLSAMAQYRCRIDASIFIHMGFNFATAVLLALSRYLQ
ncbi:MAG: CPBP family intramembrane glutamic endopeptidase [Acidimicrobiia bacterium]